MNHMQEIIQHTLSVLDEPRRQRDVPDFDFEIGVQVRGWTGRVGVVVTDFEPPEVSGPMYPGHGGSCEYEIYHAAKGYKLDRAGRNLSDDSQAEIEAIIFAQHERATMDALEFSRARAAGFDY